MKEENELMKIYEIAAVLKTVYLDCEYWYDNLSNSVQYAKINMNGDIK